MGRFDVGCAYGNDIDIERDFACSRAERKYVSFDNRFHYNRIGFVCAEGRFAIAKNVSTLANESRRT
jgi:hypothetical protein